LSKINDSTGGGNKPANDPLVYEKTLDVHSALGPADPYGQCVDTSSADGEVGIKPFGRPSNDYYNNGLTNVMDMYDNLRSYFNAEDVTFMNIDKTWEGTIELTSTEEVRKGAIKVISVNGTALGFSEITPAGGGGRFIAIHWGPNAQVYHPIYKPGTYPLPLSDGGQLIVEWKLDDAGKPANEVRITYRSAQLAEWQPSARISEVEGKAVVYTPESKHYVSPGQRINLPESGIAETTVSVYGEEWVIVSENGKVCSVKEGGLPKIYFEGPKQHGERMSVKPRPANPFIVTPDGELYLAKDVVDKLLWEERLRTEAHEKKPAPSKPEPKRADRGMPRLTNPDEFIEAPKADLDPFSKGKKGGGPFKFAQNAQEFAKHSAGLLKGGDNTAITPVLKTEDLDTKVKEALEEPRPVADAEAPKGGGTKAVEAAGKSPASKGPVVLLKSLSEFHGKGKVSFLNLLDSPAEIHLASDAENPIGSANLIMIGDETIGLSEVTRNGQRVIDLYSASSPNEPVTIDKPGEHLYASLDGGMLRLDWTEMVDPDGKPYGRVEVSHIPQQDVQAYIKGSAAKGKGFYKVGNSLHAIEIGEKIHIPSKGLSEVYVVFGEESWKINGFEGKVDVSPFESSKGMNQIYYDVRYDMSSFGTPRNDHPFHITPGGDAYLVYDKSAVENGAMNEPKVLLEGTKGSLHMGELMSSGAFNVLGGAIVVCGVEAMDAIYEDATGETMPEGAKSLIHPAVGVGTFYGLSLWMESAATPGAMDLIAFNANFARATPAALAAGTPIFYGTSRIVSDMGLDPMSFEGQLATTTVGGVGLAAMLGAELPAFLTVGGYTTGASLMSAGAIGEIGILGTSTILLGEGLLVAGAGAAGYGIGTYVIDPAAGSVIYNFQEETPYSDGTLSGWAAEDGWHMAALGGTIVLGPAIGAYILIGEKVVENYQDVPKDGGDVVASKPDPLYNPDGPFTTFI